MRIILNERCISIAANNTPASRAIIPRLKITRGKSRKKPELKNKFKLIPREARTNITIAD
jgi:hypothetical protein